MKNDPKLNSIIQYSIEVLIRLGFLIVLILWCFQILYPFSGIIIWGAVLALAAAPVYNSLNEKLNNKPGWASAIIVILGLTLVIIPSWLFFDSLISGIKVIGELLRNDSLDIPLPPEKVADLPLIGDKLYYIWNLASVSLEETIVKYKVEILEIAGKMFSNMVSLGTGILQIVLSTIIAGVLLATKGTEDTSRKFFERLIGDNGSEIGTIIAKTIQNVTKGVLGVAIIQSSIIGIGLLLAGVPYAGLWTLIIMIIAILQIPLIIFVIPFILYLFSTSSVLAASLWTIYLILTSLIDNVLKPLLLGKGAPVPMLVIFLGVIGGFMLSGFIGLFTGAIIISIGYKLFMTWLNEGDKGKI